MFLPRPLLLAEADVREHRPPPPMSHMEALQHHAPMGNSLSANPSSSLHHHLPQGPL